MGRERTAGNHRGAISKERGTSGPVRRGASPIVALGLLALITAALPASGQESEPGQVDVEDVDKRAPPADPGAQPTPEAPADPGADTPVTDDPLSDIREIEKRELEKRTQQATDRYRTLIDATRALLKQPETPAAPPPSLGIECKQQDEIGKMSTSQLVQDYVKSAGDPESAALAALIEARRGLQSLGEDASESYELESALAGRLIRKAEQLLRSTRKQRDKILPVVAFANRTAQMMQLLGDSGLEQKLIAEVGAWAAELLPPMIDDIAKKHDYSLVNAVFQVARAANSAGFETGNADVNSLMARIEAVMQFDLTLTFHLKSTGANGNVEEWELKSEFPLRYTLGGSGKTLRAVLVGNGTGKYVSYVDKEPGNKLTMQATSFPVGGKIEDFDACLGSATVVVDQFYAQTETYLTHDGFPAELPIVQWAWIMMFEDRQSGGAFAFKVPVKNLNATAIDRDIRVIMGVFDGTLTIKLVHRPK